MLKKCRVRICEKFGVEHPVKNPMCSLFFGVLLYKTFIYSANFCQLDLKCTTVVSVTSVHGAYAKGCTRQLYINLDDFTSVILVLRAIRILLPLRSVLLLQFVASVPPSHVCIKFSLSVCVCAEHLKRCKTSIFCGGPGTLVACPGQWRPGNKGVQTYPLRSPWASVDAAWGPGGAPGRLRSQLGASRTYGQSLGGKTFSGDHSWDVHHSSCCVSSSFLLPSSFRLLPSGFCLIKLLFTIIVFKARTRLSLCKCVHWYWSPTGWYQPFEGNTLPGRIADLIWPRNWQI